MVSIFQMISEAFYFETEHFIFFHSKIYTYIEVLVIWVVAANVNIFIVQLLHAIDEKK